MFADKEKREKKILTISLWVCVATAVAELVMSIVTSSQAVLMDAVVDAVELIVTGVTLALMPYLYKPVTEKRPYGYFQVESLIIIIKGFMLLAVAVSLIVSNASVMLGGGHAVNNVSVAIYEAALGLVSLTAYIVIRSMNKRISSPSIKTELYSWKVDFAVSFALGLAFLLAQLLADTPLGVISPYFDQIAAIALSLCLIPGPVRMIVGAVKSLLLFPPKEHKREDIEKTVVSALSARGFELVFLDITQTGRKLWLSVSFATGEENISIEGLKELYALLNGELGKRYEGIDIQLIPLWKGYEAEGVSPRSASGNIDFIPTDGYDITVVNKNGGKA